MNSLATGTLIILFFLLGNAITALIVTQVVETTNVPGCDADDNLTECNNVSQTSFVSAVLEVSVEGIDGAPQWFNDLWLIVNVLLLVLAGFLIVSFFIGLIFGGSS